MFRFLLEKEFKQIARNRFLPKLILVYPVIMMILMPWAANLDVKDIRLTVIDSDRSSFSKTLAAKASGSDYFEEALYADSYAMAIESIEKGESDILLEIPQGFENGLMNGLSKEVYIASNAVDGIRGSIAASYLASVVSDYSVDLLKQRGIQRGVSNVQLPGVQIISNVKYNPTMDYKIFMVPALMVIIITIIGGFLPALNIVSEKEAGTIEQINVTPVSKFKFIFSKLIPYWIIGFIILTNTLILARVLYGIVPQGSIIEFYLLSLLFLMVVSGFGLLISTNSATMQQAMFVMFFFLLIMILMSGLFTPVNSMPAWAQYIAALNPMKYFTEIMRMLFLKGSGIAEMIKQIIILCGFAVVLNLWAVLSYHKSV